MGADVFLEIMQLVEGVEMRTHIEQTMGGVGGNERRLAHLVAGAPIDLHEKYELLSRLSAVSAPKAREAVDSCLLALEATLKELHATDGHRIYLADRHAWSLEEGDDCIDYDLPAATWEAARDGIRAYLKGSCDENDDPSYWKVRSYDLGHEPGEGFPPYRYEFTVTDMGAAQYFTRNRRSRPRTWASHEYERWFGGASELNLSIPFRPGDIVETNCLPFAVYETPLLLIEVGDDCCGVQALFPNQEGVFECGALKHSHCHPHDGRWHNDVLSPLYRLRSFTGTLPEACLFWPEVSMALHANPELGKLLFDAFYASYQLSAEEILSIVSNG